MAIPALIAAGLSLLPKLPEIWDSVAKLFGKDTPKKVEEAADLANTIVEAFNKGNIPPQIQVELQKIFAEHEENMARIALDEKKLDYADLANQRELNKIYIQSEDEYVRRTRPTILRRLFGLVCTYTIGAPTMLVLSSKYTTMNIQILSNMLESIGQYLFGLFCLAYLGYTGARMMDKRNPNLKNSATHMIKAEHLMLKKQAILINLDQNQGS